MREAFTLGTWRTSARERRRAFREAILRCVVEGERINTQIDWLKRTINFGFLSEEDQNSFNVAASQARRAVEGWLHVDEDVRQAFLNDSLAPSGLAKAAKERLG